MNILKLHHTHIEQDQSFLELPLRVFPCAGSPTGEAGAANLPTVPPVFSWRSAGVAGAMLAAIVLIIALVRVLQP